MRTDVRSSIRAHGARAAAIALLAAVPLAGCAQSMAMDHERTLAAAGFQMKLANTPERTQQIESLPQRKLTRVSHPEGLRFVYADAKYCNCVYVGTEQAYDRYQRMEMRQRIADEQVEASMNWGVWGPWGPWW